MYKRTLLIAAAVLMSGCALTREQAQEMTSLELCERAYAGAAFGNPETQRVALGMVAERGDSCNNYASILATQQVNRMAMFSAGMGMLQQSGPRPYPGPATTTVQCVQQGVFTNCSTY